jgi:DNA repair protein RadC
MEIKVRDHTSTYNNPEKVACLFRKILSAENDIDRDKEHVWVLGLNTRNCMKYVELVSLGTLDSSLIQPREIFRMGVAKAVKSIIVAHNHPSNAEHPSTEDRVITQRLKGAGEILCIPVLDHVIVTEDGYFSFAESGLL